MDKVYQIVKDESNIKTLLADIFILTFIYFIPAISHLFAFPIYYLDPMRIALVVALVTTNKRNTYLIALTLPIFSFFISSHPSVLKAFLLAGELLLNISLFFWIKDKINNPFFSFLLSITVSKIAYYSAKFLFINYGLLDQKLISTPIEYQLILMLLLSCAVYWIGSKKNSGDI